MSNIKTDITYKLLDILIRYELNTTKTLSHSDIIDAPDNTSRQVLQSDNYKLESDCTSGITTISYGSQAWTLKPRHSSLIRTTSAIASGKFVANKKRKRNEANYRLNDLRKLAEQLKKGDNNNHALYTIFFKLLRQELQHTKHLIKTTQRTCTEYRTDNITLYCNLLGKTINVDINTMPKNAPEKKLINLCCKYEHGDTYLYDLFHVFLQDADYETEKHNTPTSKLKQRVTAYRVALTNKCAEILSR